LPVDPNKTSTNDSGYYVSRSQSGAIEIGACETEQGATDIKILVKAKLPSYTSPPTPPTCGNGVLEGSEVCDYDVNQSPPTSVLCTQSGYYYDNLVLDNVVCKAGIATNCSASCSACAESCPVDPDPNPEEPTVPVVSAQVNANDILLSWNRIDDANLTGYKVVISQNDSTPVYPANGYLVWIIDRNTVSYTINNSVAYYNGDFGSYLTHDQSYYFSVTAVYSTGEKVAGNVLSRTYPGN
jgi:hypothetical protein